MKKIFLISLLIVLILLTTVTKNSTKNIDNQIFQTKENIRLLQDKYESVFLDYNFLSSPKKLIEYQKKFFDKELNQITIQKIKKIYFHKDLTIVEKFIKNDN